MPLPASSNSRTGVFSVIFPAPSSELCSDKSESDCDWAPLTLPRVLLQHPTLVLAEDDGPSMPHDREDDTLLSFADTQLCPSLALAFLVMMLKSKFPYFFFSPPVLDSGCSWLSEKVTSRRSDCQITAYLCAALLTLRTVIFCRNELLLHPPLRWREDGAM